MKLLRIGEKGNEKPALLDKTGVARDLSGEVGDIAGSVLSPESLARLRQLDVSSLPALEADARVGACVGSVGKFVCVGLNYLDHAAEIGATEPSEPILFMKATSAINGPFDDIVVPKNASKLDWEVELGVVVGTEARYVEIAEALDYVAGYCVVNDLSERGFQLERSGQWVKGKSADTLGPIGPWLVTKDEIKDPQALGIWLEVDGHRYQNGCTGTMIFGVAEVVSYISHFMSLQPGDVIATGTPKGVGKNQRPHPVYLKSGQTMSLGIDGLGVQTQRVCGWS